jgi:hypothetical protein
MDSACNGSIPAISNACFMEMYKARLPGPVGVVLPVGPPAGSHSKSELGARLEVEPDAAWSSVVLVSPAAVLGAPAPARAVALRLWPGALVL